MDRHRGHHACLQRIFQRYDEKIFNGKFYFVFRINRGVFIPSVARLFSSVSEKAMEKKILTSETSKLVAQSNNLRSETIHLERRIYELLSARTALDSERRMLSEKIERINALVRNLR